LKVELLHYTPLWVASKAIRKCWASEDKSDTLPHMDTACVARGFENIGEKDKALIERVGNKNKHSSTLEHLNYSFDIDGISRACLQELARHRHASLSVKSSRYTLKELKDSPRDGTIDYRDFLVMTPDSATNEASLKSLSLLKERLEAGTSNDLAKYCLPEAYKTSLVWTINARSLQNFLSLRTDKSALWEIRDLANEIYTQLPEEHKYLFVDFIKEYNET
jgi:thymidylate synthase (FAD)